MNKIFGTILTSALLLSCSSKPQVERNLGDERNGGVLVLNQFQGFATLFPPASYESSASFLGTHIYEPLMGYDSESKELIPRLAESWTMNEDGTEFTFKIRQNVFFHDDPCFADGEGRRMTSEDVLYCLKSLCEYNAYNRNSWLFTGHVVGAYEFYNEHKSALKDDLAGIQLFDDDEIRITLVKPNVEFIHVLAHYGTSIYPEESKKHYGKRIGEHPVGTGPFRPKVLRAKEICVMERNKRYWAVDDNGNSLPYLDGIKVGFEETGYPVSLAMSKDLLHFVIDADMIEDGDRIISMTENEDSNYSSSTSFDLETIYLGFLNDEGVFMDPRIRAAFGLALDKEKITKDALGNSCTPGLHGLIPPAFKNYPYQEVDGFVLNIEKAQALLREAGFPDGDGFPVTTLQIQNRYKDVVVAQEIQKDLLANLGISLSITTLPREQHFQRTEDKQAQIWLDNWSGDFIDPQNFLNLMLARNTPEEGASYLNIYRYMNPVFDSIVDEAVKVKDEKKRMQLYCMADLKLMQEAAIIPIYYEKKQLIQHKSVKGLMPPILNVLDFREVYLKEE